MQSAAKVGLLIVVFVGLLLGGYAVIGKSLFSPKRDTYVAEFSDAAGMVAGTRVLMAGVNVGTVTKVELVDPTKAKVTLALLANTAIPVGTQAVIPGSLIGFGDTPLSLIPPVGASGVLPPGSVLQGTKAGPLDAILPGGGKEAYTELTKTLTAVRKLLENDGMISDVQKLMRSTSATMDASQGTLKQFGALAEKGNLLIAENRATLNAIMKSTQGTLADVNVTAHAVAEFAKSGKLQTNTTQLMEKANKIANQASEMMAQMNTLISDPKLQGNLKTMTTNFAEASKSGPGIASNMEKITSNVAVMTEKSKNLPDQIAEMTKKAAGLEDQLSKLLDQVSGLLGKKPSTGSIGEIKTEMDLFKETQPGYWRTDVSATVPTKGGFMTFGLRDAFEGNKVTAQFGKTINSSLDYRYGIYGSKPGIGVDYDFGSKFGFRGDVWDINNPRLDGRIRYEFGNGFIGWLGIDRIFHDNAPTFGVGIRR